uniref:Uncharacterized protein n=1 Tax=viral metagenome TaxID=1070528 RepID=A0A6C0JMJ7_9ZZZZ
METTLPPNFRSMLIDFTNDLTTTYPEFSYLWSKWADPEITDIELKVLFDYCLKIYPQRFFDILYQNDAIFSPDDETDTYFLPNVSFRLLFNCEDVSESTKKTLWKYLQLVLFTIVGGVKDKSSFGDTMNLFEGIDEKDLQEKLADTMSGITDFFKNLERPNQGETDGTDVEDNEVPNLTELPDMKKMQEEFKNMFEQTGNPSSNPLPDLSNIQSHLKSLFEGKIGSLAKEMAEEISEEFKDILEGDTSGIKNSEDVIKKLMKNPKKIMDLMKTVSSKLDNKMKSGEISKEELMKEAGDLLGKMKDMGGGEDLNQMFKEMAKKMGGLGKNMRLDTTAIERMTKMNTTKEKMKSRFESKKQLQQEEIEKRKEEIRKRVEEQRQLMAKYSLESTDSPNNFVFRLEGEEAQEKSFIHPDLLKEETKPVPLKKKKNKNKK